MALDTVKNEYLGKGWSFPPTFNTTVGEVVMTEQIEDIQKSLEVLLATRVGERVMQPKYGCNMDDLVFEALDTGTKTLIKDKVQTAILYFEPRIDAKKIELNTDNELEGIIVVEIEYVVRSTNSRFNFVYPYYRNEGTELTLITTNSQVAL
jgi:phage baseplate assembly protein W